jgi:hypothetical protein
MSWRELLGFQPRIEDLAARLLRQVGDQPGDNTWTYDSEAQVLRSSAGATINLANIFREYANAPRAGRRALVEKYLSFFSAQDREIPKLWTLAAKGIYVAVRSKYDYMTMEIESRTSDKPVSDTITWPLVGDLCLRLLYDSGPNMGHVQRDTLAAWGQPEAEVKQRALNNLKALQRPQWELLSDGVYKLVSDVAYEESWFLIDAVMEQLPFAAHAVVMPVNRGVLLAVDGRADDALSAMLHEALRSLQENPWPLSGTMLTKTNGSWQAFAAKGLIAKRAHTVASLNLAGLYKDQQDLLQTYYESIDDDVYVAGMDLQQLGEDIADVQSWCSWAEGVRALLPKTDVIIFGKGESQAGSALLVVPWDRVVEICGQYLQTTSENPPRFRVTDFPNDDEWQRLHAAGEMLPQK